MPMKALGAAGRHSHENRLEEWLESPRKSYIHPLVTLTGDNLRDNVAWTIINMSCRWLKHNSPTPLLFERGKKARDEFEYVFQRSDSNILSVAIHILLSRVGGQKHRGFRIRELPSMIWKFCVSSIKPLPSLLGISLCSRGRGGGYFMGERCTDISLSFSSQDNWWPREHVRKLPLCGLWIIICCIHSRRSIL